MSVEGVSYLPDGSSYSWEAELVEKPEGVVGATLTAYPDSSIESFSPGSSLHFQPTDKAGPFTAVPVLDKMEE